MGYVPRPPPLPGEVTAPEPPAPHGQPVPWGILEAALVFLLSVLLTFVVGGVGLLVLPPGLVPEAVINALVNSLTLVVLALTTLGWVAARHTGAVGMLTGPRRASAREVLIAFGVGLAAVVVITAGLGILLYLLLTLFGQELPAMQETLREAARDPQTRPFLIASAVLIAPVAEELFFRGMLLPAMAKRVGLWPGIVLSALVFGLVHLPQAEDLLGGVLLLVRLVPLGILFGWLYHWRGTLAAPVIVHAVFNAASVALLLAGIG